MKTYNFKLFDGYSTRPVTVKAESYDAAVRKFGIIPPGYILSPI